MLSKALDFTKSLSDGSKTISDLGVFWKRPRAWVGGELLNRAGFQPARCLYQHLLHRPTTRHLPERLVPLGEELIENGMIMIPDFLPDHVFDNVRREYDMAFAPDRPVNETRSENRINKASGKYTAMDDVIQSAVISGVRQESVKIDPTYYPDTVQHIIRNDDIWALVSAGLGRRVKYDPGAYFQRESRADQHVEDNEHNIVLHQDVFYSSYKAFLYINESTADNGAFVVVPRSHRLTPQRLRHEYLYSVDIARQKAGKSVSHPVHSSGRLQVFGRAFRKGELRELQAVGKPNTLVIANVRAFHRRGGSGPDGARCMVRMSFRHVETLHHKLYPHIGTPKAKRLARRAYF